MGDGYSVSREEVARQLRRRAVVLDIGGFRPPTDPATSWFGRVNLALPNETWPEHAGEPMLALAQVNLTEMPFRSPGLEDLDLLTVFIGPRKLPHDTPTGEGWCLRAYRHLADLRPLAAVPASSPIKPFPMRPRVVEEDFPCWEDVDIALPPALHDDYWDLFPNVDGFKLGGWPSLIQSKICWAARTDQPIAPAYVFQIDSTEKGCWAWGHGGVGYFGRGPIDGRRDEWALAWQCL